MFQTKVAEKIKAHILCSTTYSQKLCCLCDAKNTVELNRWQYGAYALHAWWL